jgi:DNA-binding LacI/PurR family transcriptional regulator
LTLKKRASIAAAVLAEDHKIEVYTAFNYLQGVQNVIHERGYQTDLIAYNFQEMEGKISKILSGCSNEGIIFIGFEENLRLVNKVRKKNFPYVVVSPELNLVDDDLSCVLADEETGAYQAVRHLIMLGHKKIGLICGSSESHFQCRAEGYKKALEENNIPYDTKLVRFVDDLNPVGSYKASLELLKENSDLSAFFVVSDYRAVEILHAIKDFGLRVPEDISLASFDDLSFAKDLEPPLTTVRKPKYEMGQEAGRLLMEWLSNPHYRPQKKILRTELIKRNSCAYKSGYKGELA